jgi:hypothetical protein
MASNHRHGGSGQGGDGNARQRPPEWADGLKQLYDSVVEEDLPDAFRDLLDRLDTIPSRRGGGGDDGASGTPDARR